MSRPVGNVSPAELHHIRHVPNSASEIAESAYRLGVTNGLQLFLRAMELDPATQQVLLINPMVHAVYRLARRLEHRAKNGQTDGRPHEDYCADLLNPNIEF